MHVEHFLSDVAISIIASGFFAILMKALKQPFIIGYIIAGIILGPGIGFSVITDRQSIELISEIGLIFLLFIIGLEINLKDIISSGKNITIIALSQVIVGILISFIVVSSFLKNFTLIEIIYITFCLNLTSTLIVVKILRDKFEMQTLSSRLTIGVLILQDFFAVIFLAFQKNFLNPDYILFLKSFFYTLVILIISYNFYRYILSRLIHKHSRSVEFVIIVSISYCFLVSVFANMLGLSKEMGALIAGVSIANSPYSEEIVVRVSSLRDFFVTLFFVSLGLKIPQIDARYFYYPFIFVIVILVSRFFSIIYLNKFLKIGMRPLFITSINLFPLSEFGLVIVSLGFSYSHISNSISVIMLITMIITSIISSYLISYSHSIYSFFAKIINLHTMDDRLSEEGSNIDVLILGYNKIGYEIIKLLKEKEPSIKISVADFNVFNKTILKSFATNWIYVDLSNIESVKKLEKTNPSIIISPMTNLILKGTNTYQLLLNIKKIFPKSYLIFIAEDLEEYQKLSDLGAKVINISSLASRNIVRDVIHKIKKESK